MFDSSWCNNTSSSKSCLVWTTFVPYIPGPSSPCRCPRSWPLGHPQMSWGGPSPAPSPPPSQHLQHSGGVRRLQSARDKIRASVINSPALIIINTLLSSWHERTFSNSVFYSPSQTQTVLLTTHTMFWKVPPEENVLPAASCPDLWFLNIDKRVQQPHDFSRSCTHGRRPVSTFWPRWVKGARKWRGKMLKTAGVFTRQSQQEIQRA